MHELHQPERFFQDPIEDKGLMEAQYIWGEVEEVEVQVEDMGEEEEVEEEVEEGDAASFSSSLLVRGILEEVAAAATPSLLQCPLGVCPSPTAMAASLGSPSEDHGLSRQDEVPST